MVPAADQATVTTTPTRATMPALGINLWNTELTWNLPFRFDSEGDAGNGKAGTIAR